MLQLSFFLILFCIFGTHFGKKSVCKVDQVHLSYGKFFSDRESLDRYFSVMMVTENFSCTAPKLEIYDKETKVGVVEVHTETEYSDPDIEYKRKSFIFYVPKHFRITDLLIK